MIVGCITVNESKCEVPRDSHPELMPMWATVRHGAQLIMHMAQSMS